MIGKYIVIEGQDGTGKSTQVQLLVDYFRGLGVKVVVFEEPGGSPSTDVIRKLLKTKHYQLDGLTNVLLFSAARRELWTKIGQPTIDGGGVVIVARNWWSTLAYQHFGQGVSRQLIEQTTAEFLPERYVKPDVGIILTLPDKKRAQRLRGRGGSSKDSFESRGRDFQDKVNAGYLEIAGQYDTAVIDASPKPDKIHQEILKIIIKSLLLS
ncbi:MAG: dTMP kinase [Candidatus Nomurabacteria bacterium]|jgi:dTMP kinase|nr:dTMP kinase [Candidatus Nomurabacteria bacterium]